MEKKEALRWNTKATVRKYEDRAAVKRNEPYAVVERKGNIGLNAGLTLLWNLMTGNSSAHFTNAVSTIEVGNGTAVAAPTQTGLDGASQASGSMDATYPIVAAQTLTLQSTFDVGDANFAWEEWGITNGTTMLNRKVTSFGTKSGGIWVFQVDLTLA